jgi:hypothetical protein
MAPGGISGGILWLGKALAASIDIPVEEGLSIR